LLTELRAAAHGDDWKVSLPDEGWVIKLRFIQEGDPEFSFRRTLAALAAEHGRSPALRLEASFPLQYPASPPLVRVVWPRLARQTGHVTADGAVCMHALSSNGWVSTIRMHDLLIEMRLLFLEGGIRLDPTCPNAGYSSSARGAARSFN
jgi:hypothetical protein